MFRIVFPNEKEAMCPETLGPRDFIPGYMQYTYIYIDAPIHRTSNGNTEWNKSYAGRKSCTAQSRHRYKVQIAKAGKKNL
jgi:hypothetical protein